MDEKNERREKADKHPIRIVRKERGWSLKDLALKSGVGMRTIQGIESQFTHSHYSTRKNILEALGIPYEQHSLYFPADILPDGTLVPDIPNDPVANVVNATKLRVEEIAGLLIKAGLHCQAYGAYVRFDPENSEALLEYVQKNSL